MVIAAARAALARLLTAEFRGVFFKSLGLTLLVLVAIWLGIGSLFDIAVFPWLQSFLPDLPSWVGWVGLAAAVVAGIGLAVALAFLIAPVSAIVAGLFLDEVAEAVERYDYPADPPGAAMPPLRSLVISIKFFGVVVAGNVLALLLLLVPGVNLIAFFIINGYLLGREFFEFAAMRYLGEEEARALRRRHAGTVFLAGLLVAAFLAVPLVNLATPIFAAAMMVHLFKAVAARDARAAPYSAGAGTEWRGR